jgi:glutamine amidotransferase
MSIAIVDHGRANVRSVENMFRRIGVRPVVAQSAKELGGADRIVVPGIGAFDAVRERLSAAGFDEALDAHVRLRQRPLLGICVGMQVMTQGSAEGTLAGYGWFPGSLHKFSFAPNSGLRTPHMGWARVTPKPGARLFVDPPSPEWRCYFVHSYFLPDSDDGHVAARSHHGVSFAAAIERDNLFGLQFHPEKSHAYGMALFQAFLRV